MSNRRLSSCSTSTSLESENIGVYLRIRPFNQREDGSVADPSNGNRRATPIIQIIDKDENSNEGTTVKLLSPRSLSGATFGNVQNLSSLEGETFTFDLVGSSDVQQEDLFEQVAKPIADYCLLGYNGTIFAYGQTGSGKTFTMQGPTNEDGSIDYENRGIIPRTFDYLFQRIREEERRSNGKISYFCKCSYVEIYNESIFDLLDPKGSVCNLREDSKKGVFVEGCLEEIIHNSQDAFLIFEEGSRNRHVAETSMNRESSRSHSIFTVFIQSKKLDGEVLDVRDARFNLVDLAGSERQQLSGTTGTRLKEAGNINKSLLALSNVINALVDVANGRARHVHYRDSKLTFLLRDSLGGNSKTLIVATVSPSIMCQSETLSTLRFAQRAKQIRNKAVVNKDIQGNLYELQAEVRRLRNELLLAQASSIGGGGSSSSIRSTEDVYNQEEDVGDKDAYFMLRMALQRQTELNLELSKQQKQMETLEELLRRREQQINSEKMVAKLRDRTIKDLQERLDQKEPRSSAVQGNNNSVDLLDIFEGERAQFKQAISELRKQLEHHPEVTRFAYESMQLQDKLKRVESYYQALSTHETELQKHRKYQQALAERLLIVEKERDDLVKRVKTQSKSDDEIPIQSLLQPVEIEKVLKERDDLESKYEDLLLEQELLRTELEEFKLQRSSVEGVGKKRRMEEEEEEFDGEKIKEMKRSIENSLITERDLNGKLEKLENENSLLKATINELQVNAKSDTSKLELMKNKVIELQKENDGKSEEISKLSLLLDQTRNDKNLIEREFSGLRAEIQSLTSKLSQLEANYQIALNLFNETTEDLNQSKKIITELEGRIQIFGDEIKSMEPLKSIGGSADEILSNFEKLQQEISKQQGNIRALEESIQAIIGENNSLKDQILVLESSQSREKLVIAESTIATLQKDIQTLEDELSKLCKENDRLIQHSNLKQKLQYHLQIKEENNQFREEVRNLREELMRLTQRNTELEEVLAHGHFNKR